MMKIISGKLRGRKLISPSDNFIRPTSNRAKQMIFNTLNSLLEKRKKDYCDLTFIDFFSGIGSLGIEAISRGAENVFFIDNSSEAIKLCKKNCENQKILKFAKFLNKDIIKSNFERSLTFDIFFCDPPYMKYKLDSILKKIEVFLKINSLGVIELPLEQDFNFYSGYEIIKIKKVSKSKFLFLEKK